MNKRPTARPRRDPRLLAACGGSDDSFDDRADIADPKVSLVHAVPGGPNVSLFRDDRRTRADVTNMAYKGASNYFDTDRGTHTWEVRTATTPPVSRGQSDVRDAHRQQVHADRRAQLPAR